MSYFLFDGQLELGKKEQLSGEETRHLLHSRRVKKGEIIELQDQLGRHFRVVLEELSRHSILFQVQKEIPAIPASPLQLELIVGLTKEKALDWILQKGTELGVAKILIFTAHFSPRTITARQRDRTLQRWQKIVQAACKQCGRQKPPEIGLFADLKEVLSSLSPCPQQWVLTTEPIPNTVPVTHLLEIPRTPQQTQRIVIGPEGGLHPEELALADEYGMQGVSFGRRVLRSETAVLSIATILQFLFGDLGTDEHPKKNS